MSEAGNTITYRWAEMPAASADEPPDEVTVMTADEGWIYVATKRGRFFRMFFRIFDSGLEPEWVWEEMPPVPLTEGDGT